MGPFSAVSKRDRGCEGGDILGKLRPGYLRVIQTDFRICSVGAKLVGGGTLRAFPPSISVAELGVAFALGGIKVESNQGQGRSAWSVFLGVYPSENQDT